MTASITPRGSPDQRYVLRLADTCLIQSHRLSEWCGHAPVLEEDIALTNIALDLLGQARALLTLAGTLEQDGTAPIVEASGDQPKALSEDQLAYLRDERDYLNVTLAELPNGPSVPGDFAFTVLRLHALATWLRIMWEALSSSNHPTLAAVAAKAVKEARYHEGHAADWVIRLGDGTSESARRMQAALNRLWPYTTELFEGDAVDAHAQQSGLGPAWSSLSTPWRTAIDAVYAQARLVPPTTTGFRSTGRVGVHSEHMGALLATMQNLQRSFPGGVW